MSLALHVGLGLAWRTALPSRVDTPYAEPLEISFDLSPESMKPPADAVGLGVDGIESERTTGLPAGPTRGRAGAAIRGSAPAVHIRGADARDRFAASPERARAMTGWLRAGLGAAESPRSPYDAIHALGARDDASLGVRGSGVVAVGERGLDMIGTGSAGCAGDDCAAGTVGSVVLGPGTLGGPAPLSAFDRGRPDARGLCITDDACGQRRRRASFGIDVGVRGALDEEVVRRVLVRHRSAMIACLVREPTVHGAVTARLELVVAPNGSVSSAVGAACLSALAGRFTFPASDGPSAVTVRAFFARPEW